VHFEAWAATQPGEMSSSDRIALSAFATHLGITSLPKSVSALMRRLGHHFDSGGGVTPAVDSTPAGDESSDSDVDLER